MSFDSNAAAAYAAQQQQMMDQMRAQQEAAIRCQQEAQQRMQEDHARCRAQQQADWERTAQLQAAANHYLAQQEAARASQESQHRTQWEWAAVPTQPQGEPASRFYATSSDTVAGTPKRVPGVRAQSHAPGRSPATSTLVILALGCLVGIGYANSHGDAVESEAAAASPLAGESLPLGPPSPGADVSGVAEVVPPTPTPVEEWLEADDEFPRRKAVYEAVDGNPAGEIRCVDEHDRLISETTPDNGSTSRRIEYYPSGAKFAEHGFDPSGAKQGTSRKWYESGVLAAETTYVAGARNGPAVTYYPDGAVFTESRFDRGLEHGQISYYLPDGRVWCVSERVRGIYAGHEMLLEVTAADRAAMEAAERWSAVLKDHWPKATDER